MAKDKDTFSVWCPIADAWTTEDGKGLTGPVQIAAPVLLQNGAKIVVRPIDSDKRRDRGPTHHVFVVREFDKPSKSDTRG